MLIQRYILRSHLVPFLFALSVILFLLFVNLLLELVDQIVGKGVAAPVALEVFVLNVAWMVALAVPMAVLVAVLIAFGRLSSDGEISALKASGIGIHRVAWPVFLCAAIVAVAMTWFNERILPNANHRARLLMDDIRQKRPVVTFADKSGMVIDDFNAYRILIGRVNPYRPTVEDIIIYRQEPGEFPTTILASRGEMHLTTDRKEMLLTLYRGELHAVDTTDPTRYVRTTFERQEIVLGDAGRRLARTVEGARGDREMTVSQMRARVAAHQADARVCTDEAGQAFEAHMKGHLLSDDISASGSVREIRRTAAGLRSHVMVLAHLQRSADRYLVEIHKKYAIPAACVVFVFIGLPLGIGFQTGGAARGAAVSIGFFLVYWMFLIGGEKLADRAYLSPAASMWAANLLIGAVGLCLTWRTMRR